MKPFEQLTDRGQARRLRSLVIKSLEQYDLAVSEVQLVGLFTNAIFRIRTKRGRSYIMRVCRPGWRTKSDLISEIMWLQALGRETDIRIPEPIPTRNGDFFVTSTASGVPGKRRCIVMKWIPGTLLAKRLNEQNLFKMGILFARLHGHGAMFLPPKGFTKRKMASIYGRGEPDLLFNAGNMDAFTSESRDIFRRTEAQVQAAFAGLYSDLSSLQVIHHDLHHENIKIYYGQLCPFDFEDTVWGYPVQDIAMALQDLMVAVPAEAYEPFLSAFRQGYESLGVWPEQYAGQIDTFRAGRMLWVANYVAGYQREYLRAHIDWLARYFKRYLESGLIRKV